MTIEAIFNEESNTTYTKSISQFDKGLNIKFIGIELPEEFEVHFSNERDGGIATVVKGKNDIARIPDAYLVQGDYVYAWVYAYGKVKTRNYIVDSEIVKWTPEEGERTTTKKAATVCMAIMPVLRRPVPVSIPDESEEEGEYDTEFDVQDESLIIK